MGIYSEVVDKWLDHLKKCHSCIEGCPACYEGIVLNDIVEEAVKNEDLARAK